MSKWDDNWEINAAAARHNLSGYATETPKVSREMIVDIEHQIAAQHNATFGDNCFPVQHEFVPGLYIRRIFMPAGFILTSKIHNQTHPYFILRGEVEVLTEQGMQKIQAPYAGITKAGTKRVILTHTDTEWYTVHSNPDDERDLKKIEERIIANSFADVKEELNVDTKPLLEVRK